MSDELLPYYSRELTYIRELAGEFARANPAVAERLGVSQQADEAKDPHIERLIEAFAYLSGRIRRKLDDDFPELVSGMLSVLYPHLITPIPSMAVAQVKLQRAQAELTAGFTVPSGAEIETPVVSGPHAGETCRFRTAYPLTIWPIEVAAAKLGALPFSTDSELPSQAIAALTFELRCLGPEVAFSKMKIPVLRFYLSGQDQHTFPLYELILNNTVDIVLKGTEKTARRITLGRAAINPAGFSAGESLLPYGAQSFDGYRLLSEYFAFPRKFLFIDIALPPDALNEIGNRLELHLFVNRTLPDLEKVVSADTFRLGCTPIINLFKKQADAVELDETRTEYRIEPDRRRRLAHEIYSVDRVMVAARGTRPVESKPFYSLMRRAGEGDEKVFWYARRRPPRRTIGQQDRGTDLYLTLVDLDFARLPISDRTVIAEVTCLNRDLPQHLPRGGRNPLLTLVSGGPVELECLTPPTPTIRAALERGAMWRLVSQLNLNYLSITGGAQAAETLREMLRLYNFGESADASAKIGSILEVNSQLVTRRAGLASAGGVARGMEVKIRFDEDRFADRGLYLFASVLERFIALYCSINSFSQLVAMTKQRDGVLKRWPPRAGEQVLQ
ncbi:MAG TPA: type VI secretion system baseplate subunit TssF [Tepidisphaeraceae bacterium]|jgi:type VI secretion system protein ImpG